MRILIWLGIFGVMLPAQSGSLWLRSPMTLYYWTWFPMFFVSAAVTGAFAREREHHTLETLLATRLPDRAILFGKLAAGVAYGWGLDLVCVAVSLIVVNTQVEGVRFYAPSLALGGLALSFLASLLVAGVGVLISMDAPTFQAAAQGITVVVLLLFAPALALNLLPETTVAPVEAWLRAANAGAIAAAVSAVLVVVDAALLLVARARFQRTELVLR